MSGIALNDFDEVALRYAEVFHYAFTWEGLKHWQCRVSLYCFAGMLLSALPYAFVIGTGLMTQALYLLPLLIFEILGLVVWWRLYEPIPRSKRIHQAKLLAAGISYNKKKIERYKTDWINRELKVQSYQYLELIRSLSEVRDFKIRSKQSSRYLSDRLFSSFFNLKPLIKISLLPPLAAITIAIIKSSLFDVERLITDSVTIIDDIIGWSALTISIIILLVMVLGVVFLVGGVACTLFLEKHKKQCSVQSRERLVQELLKRAWLIGGPTR